MKANMWRRLAREEDGQSLLYGAGVVVMTVALFYGAMDIGLLVLGKIQAQNAADAAALAAASLKASVHNTRSLAYRAATGQVNLTRLALVEATNAALIEIARPHNNPEAFRKAIAKARGHRAKVEKLAACLKQFNSWVTDDTVGPRLTYQAAEIAYIGNLGYLRIADDSNLTFKKDAMIENSTSSPTIGGVAYGGESLARGKFAGKSMVKIEPKINAIGAGFLDYSEQSVLSATAVAGPVDAKSQYGSTKAVDRYGITWYTVRLMPIGKDGAN